MPEFKLTYATMLNPPEETHACYNVALTRTKAKLGENCAMLINNRDHFAAATYENRSPTNSDWVLARLPQGTAADADLAITAAKAAFPKWSEMTWQYRMTLVRRAAT